MRYTVIGLGQFGQELCTELSARNIEVVAVASTDEELEQIKDLVTYAVVTDYTNPAALRELELDDQSAVIVAIGDSFEENLLVVTHLQKMGVRYIYARVMSPVHEHILSQMNVYALINLSRVASKQLASQLESPEFLRVSPMDENHSIVEIAVPRIWVGKRLRDVGLRTEHHLNLLTIRREIGRFNNLTIGFCGDLRYGRTVHSLIKALSQYEGIKVVLIAPEQLRLPSYIKEEVCDRYGIDYREVEELEDVIGELDVLYMTRVQKERFLDEDEYERVKDCFVLTAEKMKSAKPGMRVLHPLPRVNEIATDVDADPRAAYFRQVENGKFVRMALILKLLEWSADPSKDRSQLPDDVIVNRHRCSNRNCISNKENVATLFRPSAEGDGLRCLYCESKAAN